MLFPEVLLIGKLISASQSHFEKSYWISFPGSLESIYNLGEL